MIMRWDDALPCTTLQKQKIGLCYASFFDLLTRSFSFLNIPPETSRLITFNNLPSIIGWVRVVPLGRTALRLRWLLCRVRIRVPILSRRWYRSCERRRSRSKRRRWRRWKGRSSSRMRMLDNTPGSRARGWLARFRGCLARFACSLRGDCVQRVQEIRTS
jgi:hypothetical protein